MVGSRMYRQVSDAYEQALADIVAILNKKDFITFREFIRIKKDVCKKYGLKSIPNNISIISKLSPQVRERFRDLLTVKPVRTASGIAMIAVMTKPMPCPHGTCIYCPGGVKFGTPQSYSGKEPASIRAAQHNYDPYEQVTNRLKQLSDLGHKIGKIELIILGGTFLSFPPDYQMYFIKGCYDALNQYTSTSLEEAIKRAETAKIRNVGLTIETRPDWCKEKHVDLMLSYGCTRVEIGVQTLNERVLNVIQRKHSLEDVIEAFRIAKDAGYKIGAHMMPGLPCSNYESDLKDFYRLFNEPEFKPDMLKIYPTLVLEGTTLYEWYKDGIYSPYDLNTLIDLIIEVKKIVPRWVRIMRINREIPSHEIVAGVKHGNLREIVQREMARRGLSCKCIRCREVGLKIRRGYSVNLDHVKLLRESYEASNGLEIFLSYEDTSNDILIGFVRLRIPSPYAHRPEIKDQKVCLIRELHVYGRSVPVGDEDERSWQHRGYGMALMEEAERIALEEFDAKKMVVISAIGTREYYRRLGYELEGPYMVKRLG
ncbi:MAG: tRNA uridine(34) 5-carboxymethylaminomethyl modification radical SAM/GNAT enzyme Elp3 [Nitrososphaerales archaeon]|nr:tRNA uridine(34) 5-carboxymethylaminomethyl modification radical SAM/GNAT enzyme Elp3 [Nitrososphaerales archaeon]